MAWNWLRLLELDACAELLESRGPLTRLCELRDPNGASLFNGIGLPTHVSDMIVREARWVV